MASIYTGLAFLHGHIVDRELVFRLGRDDMPAQPGASAAARPARAVAERMPAMPVPAHEPCATCC